MSNAKRKFEKGARIMSVGQFAAIGNTARAEFTEEMET